MPIDHHLGAHGQQVEDLVGLVELVVMNGAKFGFDEDALLEENFGLQFGTDLENLGNSIVGNVSKGRVPNLLEWIIRLDLDQP